MDCSGLLSVAKKAIRCGADIIQLRDKIGRNIDMLNLARELRKISQNNKTIFIINDRLDIALLSQADGVHVGQEDVPVKDVRKIIGKNKLIGKSCHNLQQAMIAEKEGADYIGLGPIFSTQTKPGFKPIGLDTVSEIVSRLKIPVFVIGGITTANIGQVLMAGAENVAVCRAICWQRDVCLAARHLKNVLEKNK